MSAVAFDTLRLARKLEEAGFPPKQAAATSAAPAETFAGELATKTDIERLAAATKADIEQPGAATKADITALRAELKADMRELELRLTVKINGLAFKIGGMIALAVAIITALQKLL